MKPNTNSQEVDESPAISGVELRAIRRLLQLPAGEAATMLAGGNRNVWADWEAGTHHVPDSVAARVGELLDHYNAQLRLMSEALMLNRGRISLLTWYEELSDWLAHTRAPQEYWRVHQAVSSALLAQYPGRVSIVRFDARAYNAWLAGRKSSTERVSEWTCAYFEAMTSVH